MEKEEIRSKIASFVVAGNVGMVLINTNDILFEFERYCPEELEGEFAALQDSVKIFSEKLSKLLSKKFDSFVNEQLMV